jgi:hypothetical protein
VQVAARATSTSGPSLCSKRAGTSCHRVARTCRRLLRRSSGGHQTSPALHCGESNADDNALLRTRRQAAATTLDDMYLLSIWTAAQPCVVRCGVVSCCVAWCCAREQRPCVRRGNTHSIRLCGPDWARACRCCEGCPRGRRGKDVIGACGKRQQQRQQQQQQQ